jgi:HAE1 family hydrophobic/amphiphilic exporter-1
VVYLLMAGLFESFIHPLAIMLTVPLATVGGFAGLAAVHLLSVMNPITPVQQLDVVTMLGFVILVGIVVNNAILIVHQALNNIGYGMSHADALVESVRSRVRPILMTAFTSIGGMLPLALMPGAGSELYRGLAGVMVGGLFVATVFTLILVPVVFSVFLSLQWRLRGRVGRGMASEMAPATASVPADTPPYRKQP